MPFPITTLRTARLTLRPFAEPDAPDVHTVWNDDDYVRWAPAGFALAGATAEQARAWCAEPSPASFAVVPADGGRLLGHVSLFDADWTAMTCEIHYWTAPWARGHGYAPEAARATAAWALHDQDFARVTLNAVVPNTASRKVATAAGFQFEGILRNAALTRSGRHDLAAYSLIPADVQEEPAPRA
ncbi:GNAT family N-acetyltransferase [Actinoplanes sp. CA-030573]|uniref:GNAT family N-acetyltransferase n=1 Tax=Actinoplanes sp. CA-030573 TaxID=3239898 RepID=UPI003D8C6E10